MSALNQARVLLVKAREDFVLLEEIVASARVSDAMFGFHAQQAVEKALKAWIWALGVRPQKTHDLEALSDILSALLGSAVAELQVLQRLGIFAVVYRYEVLDWDEQLDRAQVLQDVAVLLDRVDRVIAASPTGDDCQSDDASSTP